MKPLGFSIVVAAGLSVGGCTAPMGMPQPALSTIEKIRTADIPSMRVGNFVPAPAISGSKDRSVSFRAHSMTSPVDGSFAKYLGKTIELNLKASGKFDANSPLVLDGVLTENDVSTPIETSSGVLGAKFKLTKSGSTIFEKQLEIREQWQSSFIAAYAVPDSMNHYTSLYDKLTLKLFADSDFLAAFKTK